MLAPLATLRLLKYRRVDEVRDLWRMFVNVENSSVHKSDDDCTDRDDKHQHPNEQIHY